MNIALIQTMNMEYQKAKISYEKILSLSPDNLTFLINYSNTLFKLKDFTGAVKYIRKALLIDSQNIESLNIYSASLYEAKNYSDSIVQSKKALDIDPFNLNALMNIINAYYFSKNWYAVNLYMDKLREVDVCNPLLASLDPLFSYDHDEINKSSFIKNPLEYLKEYNIKDYIKESDNLLQNLIDISRNLPCEDDPIGKTTVNGIQTLPIIFQKNSNYVNSLKDILRKCIEDYKDFYKDQNDLFIRQWPDHSFMEGWVVFLKNQGFQDSHNHLSGWLSGVIYLKVPEASSNDSGSIKFSLHGYNYPLKQKSIPSNTLEPITGSIILFPSSLYHSTVPFISDDERISLAFDLLPGKSGKRIGLGSF
jgi:tetratricopeptide (TPR) repeat protein